VTTAHRDDFYRIEAQVPNYQVPAVTLGKQAPAMERLTWSVRQVGLCVVNVHIIRHKRSADILGTGDTAIPPNGTLFRSQSTAWSSSVGRGTADGRGGCTADQAVPAGNNRLCSSG